MGSEADIVGKWENCFRAKALTVVMTPVLVVPMIVDMTLRQTPF